MLFDQALGVPWGWSLGVVPGLRFASGGCDMMEAGSSIRGWRVLLSVRVYVCVSMCEHKGWVHPCVGVFAGKDTLGLLFMCIT